ncbi:MAG: 4'-phosphopantetheinyl transferase superfamily protein [Anaerolineae bacterium]|nr:4'-phosphopantetheinyl transferase superfamily protein [Anaerolineae bacterium]
MNDQTAYNQDKISLWRRPPSGLTLAHDQVHLWKVWLEVSEADRHELAQILSSSERERAARFHFARDRERFIVGRGALRVILAGYQDIRPDQVEFCYGEHKKPALVSRQHNLEFNISHSHTLLLVAVSLGRTVGVDVEHIRPFDDFEGLAARFFSSAEKEALAAVPKPFRLQAFFTCWTRKEAFIKALGQGLYYPLDHFDVSLKPGEPAALLRVQEDPQAVTQWTMQAVAPASGYVGALVVERGPCELKFWQY